MPGEGILEENLVVGGICTVSPKEGRNGRMRDGVQDDKVDVKYVVVYFGFDLDLLNSEARKTRRAARRHGQTIV